MSLEANLNHAAYRRGELTRENAAPERTFLLLHGIYGSARNWHSFAKRVSAQHPDRAFVAVDLRKHGQSQNAPPPHTVAACAQDLIDLEQQRSWNVVGVSGHSFGGKVAIAFADARGRWGSGPVERLWVLDSDPSARPEPDTVTPTSAIGVIRVLRQLPGFRFGGRSEFRAALSAHGIGRATADWLGMNLARRPGGYELVMDLEALEAMLDDYLRLDLWPTIEQLDVSGGMHFVIGGKSPVVSVEQRERVLALPGAVTCDVLAEAGHRLHVDDPDGLLQLFRERGMER